MNEPFVRMSEVCSLVLAKTLIDMVESSLTLQITNPNLPGALLKHDALWDLRF